MSVYTIGITCEMIICNVLNDMSKCYYVAEMDEIKYQYQLYGIRSINWTYVTHTYTQY
jgi:hypothetical protein